MPTIDELLSKLVSVQGSDLHLKVGSPPVYRIDGQLHLSNLSKLDSQTTESYAEEVMPDRIREHFAETHEADFAFGRPNLGRFRVNIYRQRGSVNIVI
ncbi:MAG: type IV pili twitching motility protein PilT, partial [Acidimicrobiia bacterium]|nr:type IV pili twitching motility protein PilT [Acidimicrobiia bacterium]